jgi:hypothetical protein
LRNNGRRLITLGTLLVLFNISGVVLAGTIFAASGSGGGAGSLYTLAPTGAGTLVGALVDATGAAYGLTGLAFDPITGFLYGSTANQSPTARGHLVRVDSATGLVTDIGAFGILSTFADITFGPTGILYGWEAAGSHNMYTINTATGAATLVGSSGNPGFGGGALAANAAGVIYSMPNSATNPPGTLQTVSPTTGALTFVANLSGAPLLSFGGMVINAASFDEFGVLWGINTAQGGAFNTHLVTINPATGEITDAGRSVDRLDAIAIRQGIIPEPSTILLCGAGLVGVALWRRRKTAA